MDSARVASHLAPRPFLAGAKHPHYERSDDLVVIRQMIGKLDGRVDVRAAVHRTGRDPTGGQRMEILRVDEPIWLAFTWYRKSCRHCRY